ncbi:MAG: universal stress protein [Candidatus Melainabacteria bacterium]|nr:universal stress protein [Candidatus Melainabacteria bacterium]
MLKSILISLDSSVSHKETIDFTVNLAEHTRAYVRGLYIEDIRHLMVPQTVAVGGSSSGDSEEYFNQVETKIQSEFKKEGNAIKKEFLELLGRKGISNIFEIERGRVDTIIIQKSRTVDLVVVGKRDSFSFKEQDSVTESIIRGTVRPVIIIPPEHSTVERILVAYDGSDSSVRALSVATEIGSLLNSKLVLITVSDDPSYTDKLQTEAKEFLSSYNIEPLCIEVLGNHDAGEGIIEQLNNFPSGIIAMGAFGQNRLKEMMFGSTTKTVLSKANCPVLLCR